MRCRGKKRKAGKETRRNDTTFPGCAREVMECDVSESCKSERCLRVRTAIMEFDIENTSSGQIRGGR